MYGILYVDMDGVLSDFHKGAELLLGNHFHHYDKDELSKKERNRILSQHEKFWETLPPMPDYTELWDFVSSYEPHLLTAYPHWDDPYTKEGKIKWVDKHLGIAHNRIHVVKREEKQQFSHNMGIQCVLIDDNERNIKEFNDAGGRGIFHKNAKETILQLIDMGYHK
jgi:hypothetical protein